MATNVQKLVFHKMALDAVPAGGSFVDGAKFLLDKERIALSFRQSQRWVADAIAAVRLADDPNPWRACDDETVAGELLRRIEERKEEQRRHRNG